jgi:hypothetical protein
MVIDSIAPTDGAQVHVKKVINLRMLNPAKGNPKLFTPANEAIKFRSGNPEILPTRFRNPGDHALGGELTKCDSG